MRSNEKRKVKWYISEKEEVKKSDLVVDMEKAIVDSFNVMKKIKQKYPEEYIQLEAKTI